jgi:hypothetical protein
MSWDRHPQLAVFMRATAMLDMAAYVSHATDVNDELQRSDALDTTNARN